MMRLWITGLMLCVMTSAGLAGDAETAREKLLSRRAAEADAYRKLAEAVYGLQIDSDTLVRDFVTESDSISAAVDTFVKGIRLGTPRWYDDLSCEVPAEVTVAQVIQEIKKIHNVHYKGHAIKGEDIEKIKQYVKKDVIRVTGMGAPRADLPPDLPEGIEDVLTQIDDLPEPTIPDLWKRIPVRERLMAKRAAELDAKRKLLERIRGLRITSDTQVRDFVTEWDQIEANASGILVGAREKQVYYHSDEPIVEVTCEVPVEQVITTIKEIHQKHYKGKKVKATDIEKIRKEFVHKTFEATGMGVPNPKVVDAYYEQQEINIPDWATSVIRVTGDGTDPALDTPQGRLKAARAAELDAKRKLAEQVFGLEISSGTRVEDFVTQSDSIHARVYAVLQGGRIESTEFSDGVCHVTVSIQGMSFWPIFQEEIQASRR